jgi:hypothetical protein
MKLELSQMNRTLLSGALLVSAFVPMLHGRANQTSAAGSPFPVTHTLAGATCCGLSVALDQSNLASIQECAPDDASCQQGIAVCFADGTCQDVPPGGAVSVRYWKQYSAGGIAQRLDVVIGNISPHASPTNLGWTQTQGSPLP